MRLAEVGAYINLLATAWDSEPVATLPNIPGALWRIAGAESPDEWQAVAPAVLANFEAQGDRLVNLRLREVYEELIRHSEAQRERANKKYERKPPVSSSAPAGRVRGGTNPADAGACSSTATAPATATASSSTNTEREDTVPETVSVGVSHTPNQLLSGTVTGADSGSASDLLNYLHSVAGERKGDIEDFRLLLKKHSPELIKPVLFWAFRTSNFWPEKLAGSSGFRRHFEKLVEQYSNYLGTMTERSGRAAADKYVQIASSYYLSGTAASTGRYDPVEDSVSSGADDSTDWGSEKAPDPDEEISSTRFTIGDD